MLIAHAPNKDLAKRLWDALNEEYPGAQVSWDPRNRLTVNDSRLRAPEVVELKVFAKGFLRALVGPKDEVEDQSRNGVRVIVHRNKDGSWVDSSCQCFGSPMRAHSQTDCPNREKADA